MPAAVHHRALGLAGGAGGVDHVGQVEPAGPPRAPGRSTRRGRRPARRLHRHAGRGDHVGGQVPVGLVRPRASRARCPPPAVPAARPARAGRAARSRRRPPARRARPTRTRAPDRPAPRPGPAPSSAAGQGGRAADQVGVGQRRRAVRDRDGGRRAQCDRLHPLHHAGPLRGAVPGRCRAQQHGQFRVGQQFDAAQRLSAPASTKCSRNASGSRRACPVRPRRTGCVAADVDARPRRRPSSTTVNSRSSTRPVDRLLTVATQPPRSITVSCGRMLTNGPNGRRSSLRQAHAARILLTRYRWCRSARVSSLDVWPSRSARVMPAARTAAAARS